MKTVNINGIEYTLESVDPRAIVTIRHQPFAPVAWSSDQGYSNFGADVSKLAEGIYFVDKYDKSDVQSLEEDPETGDQWDEWVTLDEHEYFVVVTHSALVKMNTLSTKERVYYRLAAIVREMADREIRQNWKIHVVENLPEIKVESQSTPANTSNVRWGAEVVVEDNIVLLTKDGWTGYHMYHNNRDLYVIRSYWEQLEQEVQV